MSAKPDRRSLLQASGTALLAGILPAGERAAQEGPVVWDRHGRILNSTDALTLLIDTDLCEGLAKLLDWGGDPNARGRDGTTLLMWAAERGELRAIDLLVERGAEVNAQDDRGRSALHHGNWHFQSVSCLIFHGADLDLVDDEGVSPLMMAAIYGNTGTVSLLLEHGAKIAGGELEAAAYYWPQPQLCQLLLEYGADVNDRGAGGDTALMMAIRQENPEIVRLLLARGADANARNDAGQTALTVARQRPSSEDRRKILRLLRRAGATE